MTGIVGPIHAAQRAKNRYQDSDPARLALEGGGVRRRSGSATASAHRVGSWIRRRCHNRMASGRLSNALNHPSRPPRRAQPLRSALADAESSRAKGRHETREHNIIDLARGVVTVRGSLSMGKLARCHVVMGTSSYPRGGTISRRFQEKPIPRSLRFSDDSALE